MLYLLYLLITIISRFRYFRTPCLKIIILVVQCPQKFHALLVSLTRNSYSLVSVYIHLYVGILSIRGDQMETNGKELDGWYLIGELRINKIFVQKSRNQYLLRKKKLIFFA